MARGELARRVLQLRTQLTGLRAAGPGPPPVPTPPEPPQSDAEAHMRWIIAKEVAAVEQRYHQAARESREQAAADLARRVERLEHLEARLSRR